MSPIYYIHDGERLFQRVMRICDEIEKSKEIEITMHSRVLIFNILTAITEDPHPSWRVMQFDLREILENKIETLPKNLNEVINYEKPKKRLTSFHLLHWLGLRLDSICPFEKEKKGDYRNE